MSKKTHPLDEKLVVVRRYLAGECASLLERQFGIDHHDIVMYANRYVRFGEEGLKPRSGKNATPMDIRLRAVREYLEHSVSLFELADKYDVDRRTIRMWAKAFGDHTKDGLCDKYAQRRSPTTMNTSKDKAANEVIKELQEKVKDLEAENALLKKVKALVEKREAQLREIGSKPSKN